MRHLHTVERTNYDWDDGYQDDVAVSKDVVAVFDKFEDAQDYARIYAGVVAVENGMQLNPDVPEHPTGCKPFHVTYNSVHDTYHVTASSPDYVTNELVKGDTITITERRAVGLTTQKVGRDGTVVRFRATEEVAIGFELRYTCWATGYKQAENIFRDILDTNFPNRFDSPPSMG